MKYWTLVLFSDLFLVTGCGKSILYNTNFNGDRWIFCQKDLFPSAVGQIFVKNFPPIFHFQERKNVSKFVKKIFGGIREG